MITFYSSVERLENTPQLLLWFKLKVYLVSGVNSKIAQRPPAGNNGGSPPSAIWQLCRCVEPKHFSWLPLSTHWVLEDFVPFQTQQASWMHSESTFWLDQVFLLVLGWGGEGAIGELFIIFTGASGRELPLGNQARDKHMLPKIWNWKKEIIKRGPSIAFLAAVIYWELPVCSELCSERQGLYPWACHPS